ncbi:isochorismate synthase [Ilumatobacter coccineus]|uniref:isochorismate synthase n=1 Tax=Ilumatobacter coccineus (strain NBRC 103263 / KCTC 29153 / YM16-304) TaxID=1313172 RepID=A0A6C7EFG6_ILUCY|nr:isochorismate synthase [Ilumatobacter coccineus]BAN02716.1 isochorismate synthase [Ilumatobacter coccineus YM16-304]
MRAITRPLSAFVDHLPDLNDVAGGDGMLFVRDGVGLAARGVAARVAIDDAVDLLASIDHDSTVDDAAPLALGNVPFIPGADGSLIVPEVVVVKRHDQAWVTAIDGADVATALAARPDPLPSSASWAIESIVDEEVYLRAVTAARDAVRGGELTKAVIARPIRVSSTTPIDVHAVIRRLKASFGSSYRYSIDGFVGASPELLVEVDGAVVRSHPLAGTTRRSGDVDTDRRLAEELQASEKNQIEHRVVIDDVHDRLLPWASYLDWEPEPSIVKVANVQHLGTRMEGMLSQPGPTVVELVRALCPTPALGGHPRDAAIELIRSVEGFERGRYGGTVGWVDANGDGTWAVAIRCAEFSDDRRSARLVAGGGIVADSEPLAELAETQAKFQAMLSAIVRP